MHDVAAKMGAAAPASMALSDADAAKQLCMMCQDMRSLSKAGAMVGHGATKTGDIVVITAADPALKTKVGAFQAKCATMMAGGPEAGHEGHKH